MGRRGNLILGLGFSTALHAAVLTSLDPALPAEASSAALTVRLAQAGRIGPTLQPVADKKSRSTASRERAQPQKALPVRYLPAAALDTPARPRGTPPLIYPENPLIWKLAGVVRLRLLINERGTVDAVEVISAEPEGEFEEAALAAVGRLVYDPALRNGRPVRSEKFIEVTFDPYATAPR